MKITLAIPKGKKFLKRLLKEISLARNIKSEDMRFDIMNGLTYIKNSYQDGKVFLYDCETEKLEIFDYPLKEFIYHCGKDFVVPNVSLGNSYMLITMDANECTIGMLQGKSVKEIWNEQSNVPGKHNKGGQFKARFQRARQEALKQWYKKIAYKMKELVIG